MCSALFLYANETTQHECTLEAVFLFFFFFAFIKVHRGMFVIIISRYAITQVVRDKTNYKNTQIVHSAVDKLVCRTDEAILIAEVSFTIKVGEFLFHLFSLTCLFIVTLTYFLKAEWKADYRLQCKFCGYQ